MVGSTVLKLYRKGLQQSGKDLSQVRKLIAMAAQLVSHLDSKDFKGSIYSGVKGDLAKKVKETLEGAKLGDKQLEIELNLVRPSWLGVLVARAMLQTRRLGAEDKTLVQLPERLDDLLWVFTRKEDNVAELRPSWLGVLVARAMLQTSCCVFVFLC